MTRPKKTEEGHFRPLLDLCGRLPTFARDLGVPVSTVRAWYNRDSVPSEYWPDIASFGRKNGTQGLTLEALSHAGAAVALRHRRARARSQRLHDDQATAAA